MLRALPKMDSEGNTSDTIDLPEARQPDLLETITGPHHYAELKPQRATADTSMSEPDIFLWSDDASSD